MRLARLSAVSLAGSLVALVALAVLTVLLGLDLRENQAALGDLFELQARIDDLSVASDGLVLYGADPELHAAYRAEAEALQAALHGLGPRYPDAAKAAHHIGVMAEAVDLAVNGTAPPPTATAAGPLGLPLRGRIIINEIAGHGIALDTALDGFVQERRTAIQQAMTALGVSLAAATLLFAVLAALAFALIHRRIAVAVRRMNGTLDRIRAGDPAARAHVSGDDEIASLSATLNRVLDERQAADAAVAERQRSLEAATVELEATRDRLVRAQKVGQIGSWDVDLATGRLTWSDEVFHIFGISRAEFAGTEEAFFERVHPEDRDPLREARARWLEAGGDLDYEHRIVRPDGEVRWVRERARVTLGPDGEPAFTTGTVQDITTRHRLDENLRQFQTLLETSEDLCAIVDADHRFLWVNRVYLSHHRRRYAEIVGRHLREVLGERYYTDLARPPLERALAGEPQRFEAEREYPGRGRRSLLVRYQPIDRTTGPGRRVAALITDITDLKEAKAALAENARLLAMAGRAARFGAWKVDLSDGTVTWSDAVADIHGMPRGYSPSVGEGIHFYAPEHRERIRELFRACTEDGQAYDEELQIVDAHGERVWVRALGEPVRDGNGNIVRVEGAFQDVTRQREREATLRQLSQIVEQSPSSIVVTDLSARIEYVNPAFEAITGYRRDEAAGATPALLKSGLTPDAIYRDLWETITAGEVWYGEIQNRRKDGSLYWDYSVISPLTDERGRSARYVAIKEDITERKQTENALVRAHAELEARVEARTAELAAANARLQQLDQLKSLFIASMSHELRTPLNSIIGFSGLMLMDPEDRPTERQRDYLTRVESAGQHLLRLINDVIDVSKIESGKLSVAPETFDLRELAAETVKAFEAAAAREGLEILWEVESVEMHTDPIRLRQCLANFLENAVKYSERGAIRVTASHDGQHATLCVEDEGIGIAPQSLPQLFQQFARIDSPLARKTPGTGLGLYLTRKLAREVLGGDVGVESTPGQGSTFWITVPRELPERREP